MSLHLENIKEEFKPIFYPDSIAVVGASNNERKIGTLFLKNLLRSGFPGKLYPVNRGGGNILGLKAYPNIRDIPDPVEYVIVSIPRAFVLDLLDDCAVKGVKIVHFFTAGFSESGEKEGARIEEEMVRKARRGGFRIIGPNSAGIYSPAVNIPFAPDGVLGEAGSTAFISQSGSLGVRIILSGIACGLHFSKGVSFGNGSDIDSLDFLEYFAQDPETELIGFYVEGLKKGRRFFRLVKEISNEMPIVVWKGGVTEAGAEAAFSHTAALAGSVPIWRAVLKQAGAVGVESLEEFVDTLLAFQHLPFLGGRGVTIVNGLVIGGGGESVTAADTFINFGFEVVPFSDEVKRNLDVLLGQVGTILRNPLDLNAAYGNVELIYRVLKTVSTDPKVHLIIIQENIDILLANGIKEVGSFFLRLVQNLSKPVVVVLEQGSAEAERLAAVKELSKAKIAVFPNLERAAKAIANVNYYFENKGSGLHLLSHRS